MLEFINNSLNMSSTGILMITFGVIATFWEIIAFARQKKRALISRWIQKIAFNCPMGLLFLGSILGHACMYYPPTLDDTHFECPKCKANLILATDNLGELSVEGSK